MRIQAAFPAGYALTGKSVPFGSYDEATGIWTLDSMDDFGSAWLELTGTVKVAGP